MAREVAVIGGGASGMAAAIAAARAGAAVTIYEKLAKPGRKLLATGNGRCNLSNRDLSLERFHGAPPDFVAAVLSRFDGARTLEFFRGLGIECMWDRRGRYFPLSQEASSALYGLTEELRRLGARVETGAEVLELRARGNEVSLRFSEGARSADAVIIATGGKAGLRAGNEGGYDLVRGLGHTITPLRPALVALELSGGWFRGLQGIRCDITLSVIRNGRAIMQLTDEGLFTAHGLSGPAALRVSRVVGEGGCDLLFNFLPSRGARHASALLTERAELLPERRAEDFLTGLLPARLGGTLAAAAGIETGDSCKDLSEAQLRQLAENITRYPARVKGLRPFAEAQATVGGVDTREVDPRAMRSLRHDRVYFCGEILDVDGDSGGYNLQWAWSSGCVAGAAAARG